MDASATRTTLTRQGSTLGRAGARENGRDHTLFAHRSPGACTHVTVDAFLDAFAGSPWLFPALFVLVVGDAFLVVLPSETVVVALAALAGATGAPSLWALIPVAAAGAIVGDSLCYLIGRRVGIDRWGWQRRPRIAAALSRTRATVLQRTAVLIFTARYIPFARIAVNLSAGAAQVPYRRYLPLSGAAGVGWALYNTGIGLIFGTALPSQPVLAIALSVVVAIVLGLTVDLLIRRRSTRRHPDPATSSAPIVRRSPPPG
jgi:membrane protein DedA with SNARE-associated domain